jgi:hypothetical protein
MGVVWPQPYCIARVCLRQWRACDHRHRQHAEQRVENKRKDARWHTGSHALRYADDEQQQQCPNAPDKLAARAERLQHTITPARAATP